MKEVLKNKSGITIIALVITIVVLLILAVVAVTVLQEDGIIIQGQAAKQKTNEAKIVEQRKLAMLEAAANLEGTEYQGVKIPAGYAPTRIVGEDTVNEGLVIIDANRNEYVWIEVPKTTNVYTESVLNYDLNSITDEAELAKAYTDIEECLHNYTKVYRNNTTYKDIFYVHIRGNDILGFTEEEYNKLKNAMLKGIFEKGGFWIGRYEAGDALSTEKGMLRDSKSSPTNKMVTQINQIPYNHISIANAQKLAINAENTDSNYTSSLMFGVQWDLMLKFIEEKGGATISQLNSSSVSIGNYGGSAITLNRGEYSVYSSNEFEELKDYNIDTSEYVILGKKVSNWDKYILITTGASDDTKVCNIYDIAGNLWELTLEYSGVSFYESTHRGGCGLSRWNGATGPASQRYFTRTQTVDCGFRVSIF